jgi:hypothetical protein
LKRKLLEQEQVNQSKADDPADELLELLGDEAEAEQSEEEKSLKEEAVLLRPVYVRKEINA